jgi:hypothetical protein
VISSTGSDDVALISTFNRLLTLFAYSKRVRRRSGAGGTDGVVVQVVIGGLATGGVPVPGGGGLLGTVLVGAGAPGTVLVGAGVLGAPAVPGFGVVGLGGGDAPSPATSPVHPTAISSRAATLEQLRARRVKA